MAVFCSASVTETLLKSAVGAVVAEVSIALTKSLACLPLMMESWPSDMINELPREPRELLRLSRGNFYAEKQPGFENKDASESEDGDEADEDGEGDEEDDGGKDEEEISGEEDDEDEGDFEDEPGANGDGGSGDDDDDDDGEENDDEDGEEGEGEEEEEDEETPQPPAKKRK